MPKKTKYNMLPDDIELTEQDEANIAVEPAIQPDEPAVDIPAPLPPVSVPDTPKTVMPSRPSPVKKRIRIRKKATKKLSVAVLCTNPSTRRFI